MKGGEAMKDILVRLAALILIGTMLYNLPASLDGSMEFQDKVVANHLEANKRILKGVRKDEYYEKEQ